MARMTGEQVRKLRKRGLKLTQAQLAERLNCAPQTVLRAEQRGCDGIMAVALQSLRPEGWEQVLHLRLAQLDTSLRKIRSMVEGRDTPIALAIREVVEEGLK